LNTKGFPRQKWFQIDDLHQWIHNTANFISGKILHRENQTERLGAYQAFRNGIGDCDEFTDMFITLARLRAVPCRRLTGHFIRKKGNKVENHAWNEIFSPILGWITIDVALNNLGDHTIDYIVLKVEEFNPTLPDYQIQTKHPRIVHYRWERPPPIITPVV
jgi:transglutaminase-like putative cysteine protease